MYEKVMSKIHADLCLSHRSTLSIHQNRAPSHTEGDTANSAQFQHEKRTFLHGSDGHCRFVGLEWKQFAQKGS